jgi:SAM-dependent methyltransferase
MASPFLDALPEIRIEFAALADWQQFVAENPTYLDTSFIAHVADRIRANGFRFEFLDQWVTPENMAFVGDNYRETIAFAGINARQRLVLDELLLHLAERPPHSCRVYSPEALSPFALLLRGRYPRFVGSEYTHDPKIKRNLYPIEIQNLLKLSLKSNTFDAVVVNDIFEHVTDISRTLREIRRILRKGGALISTFPFAAFSEKGNVKARWSNGVIDYLDEPEYHGDPINETGALVYEIPGWDILETSRREGFSRASMTYVLSEQRGILAPHFGGIFALVAER